MPTAYGKIESGPYAGHTGISLRNDGEPAYFVSPPAEPVQIPRVGSVSVDGTPRSLSRGELDLSFPVWRQEVNGHSQMGSRLYDFMVKHDLDTLTVPFTYHDANDDWYQTDVILIKDQMASSYRGSEDGITLKWKQKRIPKPKASSTSVA